MRFYNIFLIARHVHRTLIRSRAVQLLVLLFALLVGYGACTGVQRFQTQQAMSHDYATEVRTRWEKMPDKHPHRMAHYGYIVFRPRHPLSFFDFGLESYTGNAIFLEAHRQNTVNFSEAGFSTGLLRFGEISMAMVLQLLMPLFVLFIGFTLVAAERENGTLKLLISQGVSWKEILLGKSLGLLSLVMLVFAPMVLLAIAYWLIQTSQAISGDDALRMAWLMAGYVVYAALICIGVVLVSALSQTSKAALVSLIGLWLFLCIVIPRVTQAVGSYWYPAPSKVEFDTAVEKELIQKGDSHNPNDPYYKALKDSVLQVYQVDSIEQLPFNYSGFQMKEGERISSEMYTKHMNALVATYQQQNTMARWMACLNPCIAIRNLSMALCGSDFAAYVNFQNQAEQYRYRLAQHMNDLQIKLISNQKPKPEEKSHRISQEYWKTWPDFAYREKEPQVVLMNEMPSVLALLGWLGVMAWGIYILSKKLTVS